MRIAEIVPPESPAQRDREVHGMHIVDTQTVGYRERYTRAAITAVNHAFAIQRWRSRPVTDISDTVLPDQISPEQTFVIGTYGSDQLVNQVITTLCDYQPNDPGADDGTKEGNGRLKNTILAPQSNGSPSWFALSALGRYAKHPKQLRKADNLHKATYRPLEFQVLDTDQFVLQRGLITTSIGVAATAHVLRQLQSSRTQHRLRPRKWPLEPLLKPVRLAHRAILTLRTLWKAPQFWGEMYYDSPGSGESPDGSDPEPNRRLTGIELINSQRSRFGRSEVNINDTRQQLVFFDYQPNRRLRSASLERTLGRLATGKHDTDNIADLTSTPLSIHIAYGNGGVAVPFHVDGVVKDDYLLLPGQTLVISQTDIEIPVLMRLQKKRHRVRRGILGATGNHHPRHSAHIKPPPDGKHSNGRHHRAE